MHIALVTNLFVAEQIRICTMYVNQSNYSKYSILSLVEHQGTLYSIISLVGTPGTVEICSPYPEFVLTGISY